MRSIRRAMLIPILMITAFSSLEFSFKTTGATRVEAAETAPSLAEDAIATPPTLGARNGRTRTR